MKTTQHYVYEMQFSAIVMRAAVLGLLVGAAFDDPIQREVLWAAVFCLALVAVIVVWGGRMCWQLELKERRRQILAAVRARQERAK